MIRYVLSLILLPFSLALILLLTLRDRLVNYFCFSYYRPRLKNLPKDHTIFNSDLVLHYSFECLVNYVEISMTSVYFNFFLYKKADYVEKYGRASFVEVIKFIVFGQIRSNKIGLSVLDYYVDCIRNQAANTENEKYNLTYLEKIRELYVWWTEQRTIVNCSTAKTLEEQLNLLRDEYQKDNEMLFKLLELRVLLCP